MQQYYRPWNHPPLGPPHYTDVEQPWYYHFDSVEDHPCWEQYCWDNWIEPALDYARRRAYRAKKIKKRERLAARGYGEIYAEYQGMVRDTPSGPWRYPDETNAQALDRLQTHSNLTRADRDIIERELTMSKKEAERQTQKVLALRDRRRAEELKDMDRIHNAFIEQLGKQDELLEALSQDDSPKIQAFLADVCNLRKGVKTKWTITALASKHGIKPVTLAEIWRKHNIAKGVLTLISGVPDVAVDIVEDAKSKQVFCDRCEGLGKVYDLENPREAQQEGYQGPKVIKCPQCKGTGSVRRPGDSDSRKLMFEAAGIINRKAPLLQQNNINVPGLLATMDEMDRLLDPNSPAPAPARLAAPAPLLTSSAVNDPNIQDAEIIEAS